MFNSNASVVVLLCVFLVSVQGKLSPEERLKAERECVEEVGVDYNVVLEVMNTLKVPEDDVKYKQFLNCYYKKQGFKKENGEIKFSEIKDVLMADGEGYSSSQTDKILYPCKKISAADPNDLPFLVLKCIFENLPEYGD